MKQRIKFSMLLLTSILFSQLAFSQSELPAWMKKSGWVSYYQVCQTNNVSNGTNTDCSGGTKVTDTDTFLGAIYYAGEITDLYYDYSSTSFTDVEVKVTWTSSSGDFYCGQKIRRKINDVKEFTKTSLNLSKCR